MADTTQYTDLLYEERDGIATITINRPEKYNAFRGQTCDELIHAFNRAGWNKSIGVIVLTGAGTKAFCTGGDQSAHEGSYDGKGTVGLPMEALHNIIRSVPQPVIAKVRGYAIGGGNVLATLCDLTLAGESASSARSAPKWDRSIRASAPPISPAASVRKRPARSGISAAATLPARLRPWAWSTRSCRTTSSMPRSRPGARKSPSGARPPSPSPSARSTPIPTISPASARWACRR